jgi:hypothetical protein
MTDETARLPLPAPWLSYSGHSGLVRASRPVGPLLGRNLTAIVSIFASVFLFFFFFFPFLFPSIIAGGLATVCFLTLQ